MAGGCGDVMFGLSTVRLYAYGALLVLAGLAYWRYTYVSNARDEAEAALVTANATLTAERKNTERANAAEKAVVAQLDGLQRRAREQPLPRLRCRAASVPEAHGTAVAGEAAQADDTGADAPDFDPTPELDQYGTDSEANLIQCQGAIDFLQSLSR